MEARGDSQDFHAHAFIFPTNILTNTTYIPNNTINPLNNILITITTVIIIINDSNLQAASGAQLTYIVFIYKVALRIVNSPQGLIQA